MANSQINIEALLKAKGMERRVLQYQQDFSYEGTFLIGYGQHTKIFKGSHKQDAIAVKRFDYKDELVAQTIAIQEGSYAQLFASDYVIKSFGVCLNPACHIMEKADYSLPEYMEQKKLSLAERIDIASQIASGLQVVHSKNCRFVDLKPDNVVVVNEQDQVRVKLIDFGSVVDNGSAAKFEATVCYMAPEVISSALPTKASDIYSLGIVIFELVLNRPDTFKLVMEVTDGNDSVMRKRISNGTIKRRIELKLQEIEFGPAACTGLSDVIRLIKSCIDIVDKRPSVEEVVTRLEEISVLLNLITMDLQVCVPETDSYIDLRLNIFAPKKPVVTMPEVKNEFATLTK